MSLTAAGTEAAAPPTRSFSRIPAFHAAHENTPRLLWTQWISDLAAAAHEVVAETTSQWAMQSRAQLRLVYALNFLHLLHEFKLSGGADPLRLCPAPAEEAWRELHCSSPLRKSRTCSPVWEAEFGCNSITVAADSLWDRVSEGCCRLETCWNVVSDDNGWFLEQRRTLLHRATARPTRLWRTN